MSSELETPWRVLNFSGKSFFVERGRYRAIHCLSLKVAEQKCEELNKLEQVREAAPELLAACKAAESYLTRGTSGFGHKESVREMLQAAIQKATPCSTKSSG